MTSTLAERLKLAMQGPPRVTGRALAEACSVKPPSVSDWLNGKSKTMTGPNLMTAAEFLGVRAKWLAEGVGPMKEGGQTPATPLRTSEPDSGITYLPEKKTDALTQEMLDLFAKLDSASKREWLAHLRGFVTGRAPHQNGTTPKVAEK